MRSILNPALLGGALLVCMQAAAQQPAAGQNRGVIELMNQVEAVNVELKRLRGELEVLTNALDNAQRRQRDMYLDLDTRLRRLEGSGGEGAQLQDKAHAELEARVRRLEAALAARESPGTAAAVPAAPAAPSVGAVAAPTPPVAPTPPSVQSPASAAATADANSPRRVYDAALAAYRGGDYQGAIAAFDAFVKRFPRDALAPNAQYWIGDSWFNLRDFRAAANAQQALISGYPDSTKVPDAMLNLSSAQSALGEGAAARKTLEDVIAKYPQSDAAEKARQRLGRLN
ncbi:MAG: tol-pal system protein YbgF [Burkholderiales bacterium]|nr:tol-pal system protein YbgF [Burkholderiales bacterium]